MTSLGTAGRVSARQTQVEGHAVTQAFTWNDLGLIASVGYPDTDLLNNISQEPTRSVTYSYSNGFLTLIPSYATSISYHVNTMANRIAHANAVNVDHTIDPENMRRPRQIALSNANGSWTYGNYAYDGAGNIKAINTDAYVYDKVSRLTSGSFTTASCSAKSQTAAYNPFGFMTSTTTDWATQGFTEAAGGLYNRISGVGYDAAGNTTTWGSYSYTWNRLNQMLTATSGANHTFIYTADGERVSDRVGTTKTVTIRDLANKVLRIYSYNGSAWSWSKDYVYRDGQLLATVEPPFASQVVKHMHLDHLGTPRRVTNSSRNIIATHDYYPFGMEACGTADNERMKFTGHETDGQGTGSQTDDLYYMHARYYNANIARFLSVDPRNDHKATRPHAWNLSAYSENNPATKVDPDGRAAIAIAPVAVGAIAGVIAHVGIGTYIGHAVNGRPLREAFKASIPGWTRAAVVGGASGLKGGLAIAPATSFVLDYRDQRGKGASTSQAAEHAGFAAVSTLVGCLTGISAEARLSLALGTSSGATGQAIVGATANEVGSAAATALGLGLPSLVQPPNGIGALHPIGQLEEPQVPLFEATPKDPVPQGPAQGSTAP